MTFDIVEERAADAPAIERLLDKTFGAQRREKTVYRLREGLAPVAGLRFVAIDEDGRLLASIRYWPVRIAGTPAILLGPLAVDPVLQGRGIGRALVRHSLAEAKRMGHRICVVVGEPEYYGPYGFENAGAAGLRLPGPVEAHRFQVFELVPGALKGVRGMIGRAEEGDTTGEAERPKGRAG